MKIRSKITTYYLMLIIFCIFLLGIIVATRFNEYAYNNAINRLIEIVYSNQNLYVPRSDFSNSNEIMITNSKNMAESLSKGGLHVKIYSNKKLLSEASSGILISSSKDVIPIDKSIKAAWNGTDAYDVSDDTMYYSVPIKFHDKVIGIVEYVYPLTNENEMLNTFKTIFFGGCIITMMVTIIISLYISNIITYPLNRLTESVRNFPKGNVEKVKIKSKDDEIGILADTFNEMADNIKNNIASIENEKNKLNNVLTNLNEGVIAVDGFGTTIFKNNKIDDFLGDSYINELNSIINRTFKNGQTVMDVEKGGRIYKIDAGVYSSICIVVVHDITTDRELVKKQREFITNISHELKTPVTAITGYIELLKSEGKYNDEVMSYLSKESLRLKDLVIELLELSRIDKYESAIQKRTSNLSAIMEEIILNMSGRAKKFKIEIRSNVQKNINILIDPEKISQVIINLLDNAIKYSGKSNFIDVSLFLKDGNAVIKIRDYGIGISTEEINKVFDRFYRCKNALEIGGNGIGLSIIKEIIDKHNGQIFLESEINKGSTFTVKLPLS